MWFFVTFEMSQTLAGAVTKPGKDFELFNRYAECHISSQKQDVTEFAKLALRDAACEATLNLAWTNLNF